MKKFGLLILATILGSELIIGTFKNIDFKT